MTPPLTANVNPNKINAGPLGEIYITGAVTGAAYFQSKETAVDKESRVDITNAQFFIQKTDGPIQFFVQGGGYSIPVIGVPYARAEDTTKATFGLIPQAFVKFVPSENFNIMVGKLPTLYGAEYTFTFQNMNINRGVLWNQENAVNKGVQVNYANGPLSMSASVNDGFYSDKYSWVTGLVAYAFDSNNILAVSGGANLSKTGRASGATPVAQNNQDIFNVIYTHTSGPLTLIPYFQYNRVPAIPTLGLPTKSSTTGFALLGKYTFSENFSLAARAEYINSKGKDVSLLYGPGSNAWTATVTPTWQMGTFFVRGELAYMKLSDITAGFGFGANGDKKSQVRAMVETGLLF
jgi:hypothetical protein